MVVKEGFNRIILPSSIKIPKGAVLFIENKENEILAFENDEIGISDLIYNSNGTISKVQLDGKNFRILINSLIDTGYFYTVINVSKTYPISASYNFSVQLANSTLFYKNVFDIGKGKILMFR